MLNNLCRVGHRAPKHWKTCLIRIWGSCGLYTQGATAHIKHPPSLITSIALVRSKTSISNNNVLYEILKSMPKKVDLKGLQEQRLVRKQKIQKYPPSSVYLQVLGSGAPGTSRSLYVFTEHTRYLFNCGEGTQRLAHEHKVKLSTLEHVFITHKSWENVGGLPGMLLTLQDTGVPHINLHGPPGIASLYYHTRHFLRFKDLNIQYSTDTSEVNTYPLIIQNVPLWAKQKQMDDLTDNTDSLQKNNDGVEDLYAHEKSMLKKRPKQELEGFSNPLVKRQKQEESTSSKNLSVAYICRPPPKSGALKLDLCVKAGVPPGPLLGELKKGNDITLADGRVVKAADVTDPDDPGPVFIVVEAPSEAYLDSLLQSSAFYPHQSSEGSQEDLAEVVVHFSPQEVIAHPLYQEWMTRFSSSTCHIIINESNCCMGSEAVHRIQYKLNHLSNTLFPLLKDRGIPIKETNFNEDKKETEKLVSEKTFLDCNEEALYESKESVSIVTGPNVMGPVIKARTLLTYHIRPRKKIDRTSELYLSPDVYIQECYEGEKFEPAYLYVKDKLSTLHSDLNGTAGLKEYPCITFLGTGSCIPSKTRNTSGILMDISCDKTILMDCGEGTYGQLMRLHGNDGCAAILQKLAAVYISHLHADHHIGLIRLLLARRKAFHACGVMKVPKLLLLAPLKIAPYLSSYHANFETILQDFTIVCNEKLVHNGSPMTEEEYTKLCSTLDMKEIIMTHVIHCPNSYGVAWVHRDGWKIVYSGDTMPCRDLIDIGKDCNLLIHEATMEDELEEDARIKTHCTTSQAIQVAKDMNAQHTLLTHFSQRYAKMPLIDHLPVNIGIAFDNMKVSMKDLGNLHLLYEVLVAMFSEDYDVMLERTAKKRAARKRQQETVKQMAADA